VKLPRYDALFVDEAQDLVEEEVKVIRSWGAYLFAVGDDCQKIHHGEGLRAVRQIIPAANERPLPFHYRVAREICHVADRILIPTSGRLLAETAHYRGPSPATVHMHSNIPRQRQFEQVAGKLREQVRVYADLIRQGDRLGVIVARKDERDAMFEFFEADAALKGKSKILRSRDAGEAYEPSFDPQKPICILTVKGCKGLEFRAVHWPLAADLAKYHDPEHYYTVVTRAKTSLDVYATHALPDILVRAHSESGVARW
jgi:superfamily I DNA/RNA helicase